MKRVLPIFVFLTILFILNLNAYSYINIITVSPGATLGQIADNYNTSVNSIMSLNGLRNIIVSRIISYGHGKYRSRPYYV